MSVSDMELLARYTGQNAEEAFAELVRRHVDLVHSAAMRQLRSPDLAAEVAQSTFLKLARHASRLAPDTVLSAWLYRVACREAVDVIRREARRLAREQIATEFTSMNTPSSDWLQIEPLLDQTMLTLDEEDRAALLLRYFDNKSLREVGEALGTSDDAAQKRVSRAIERLRAALGKRGVTAAAAGLGTLLSSHTVQSAPVGFAASVVAVVSAGTTLSTSTAFVASKAILMTTIQKLAVTGALALCAGAAIYEARQASRLQRANVQFQSQQEQLAAERDNALRAASKSESDSQQSLQDKTELLRLRGEVGLLRRQSGELAQAREQNRHLRESMAKLTPPPENPPDDAEAEQRKQVGIAKMSDSKIMIMGLLLYASEHGNLLPTDLAQTTRYYNKDGSEPITGTNQFELVAQGNLNSFTNPSAVIVLRETEPFWVQNHWLKTYGFADGHSEIHAEPPEGFNFWESQHIAAAPSPTQ